MADTSRLKLKLSNYQLSKVDVMSVIRVVTRNAKSVFLPFARIVCHLLKRGINLQAIFKINLTARSDTVL